jgi:malonyl-CoA O-methyltransferase
MNRKKRSELMSIIRVDGTNPLIERLRQVLPAVAMRVLPSTEAYDQWAVSYPPRAHNPLMELEERAMRGLLPALEGRVVLDLACGTGRYGLLAAENGARRVIGLDNSPAMLLRNPQRHRALATTEALPLASASVDVVLCGLALGHLPRLYPSMAEIGRVLTRGGTALISDFHPFVFLSGGQRTFTGRDGIVYSVEHYPHLYSEYHRAARDAGLVIDDVAECAMNTQQHGDIPVVLVLRMVKQAA